MLCYSTLGLPPWPLEDLCVLLARFGYQGIEIALDPEQIERRDDAEFWRAVGLAAADTDIRITNLHLGNPRLSAPGTLGEPTLLHDDPGRRRIWLDYARAAMQIAAGLSVPYVTLASGPPNAGLDTAQSWDRLLEAMQTLLAECSEDRTLLLEHEPEHFVRSTDDLLALHESTGGRVGVNLDVGHLEVLGEPLGPAIERLGDRIRNVHLEDIKDRRHRHLLPGDGDIDFAQVGAALKKIGYRGFLTADLYPFADRPIEALRVAHEAFAHLVC